MLVLSCRVIKVTEQVGSIRRDCLKLPKCWSCNYDFKWRDLMFFTRRKKCPNCNEIQHITKESNWKISVIGVPLPFVPIIFNIFSVSWLWICVISFLLIMDYFIILPYQLRFTDEEQTLI